jgi:hypothetical protein
MLNAEVADRLARKTKKGTTNIVKFDWHNIHPMLINIAASYIL